MSSKFSGYRGKVKVLEAKRGPRPLLRTTRRNVSFFQIHHVIVSRSLD